MPSANNNNDQHLQQEPRAPFFEMTTMEEAADYYEMIMCKAHRRLQVEMKKLEKVVVESGKECVICLQEVEVGKMATVLPCKHVFHRPCVGHWLWEEHTCPTCRVAVWGEVPKAENSHQGRRL